MAANRFYTNTAVATALSGSISSGATAVPVQATTGFPGSFPYTLALDFGTAAEELVNVTSAAGLNLTVTRGYGGTSAQSHSLGAVVKHVYNAVDAGDFRTHEGSVGAVHGLTGNIVGTSDTQTLGNKTLTSPTINSAALSGTFSGPPTFTGAVVFSGTPSITGSLSSVQATSTTTAYGASASGDTFDRFQIRADGQMAWGSGAGARDTNLYRAAAGLLQSDNTIKASPTGTAVDALAANLPTASTADALSVKVNAAVLAAMDATGTFRVYGGNAPATYTPTVTNGGTATFTTLTGWFQKIGKMVFFSAFAVVNAAGAGTTALTITAPSIMDATIDQPILSHFQSGTTRTGYAVKFGNAVNSATFDRIRVQNGGAADTVTNLTGADLTAGATLSIQGWYREA